MRFLPFLCLFFMTTSPAFAGMVIWWAGPDPEEVHETSDDDNPAAVENADIQTRTVQSDAPSFLDNLLAHLLPASAE